MQPIPDPLQTDPAQTDPKTAAEIARISATLERSVSRGFGVVRWVNRILTVGALVIVAITLFLVYRPKPQPSWVGSRAGSESVGRRFYSVDACKYALRNSGGDCAQPCTGKEKNPSDCGSVVHVEPSK